jgi:hypothetical protein
VLRRIQHGQAGADGQVAEKESRAETPSRGEHARKQHTAERCGKLHGEEEASPRIVKRPAGDENGEDRTDDDGSDAGEHETDKE